MKTSRIIAFSVTAVALVIVVAACGSSSKSTSSATTAAATSSTTLKSELPAKYQSGLAVPVSVGLPPYAYYNKSHQLVGTDPCLLHALAAALGVSITVVPTTLVDELLGVRSGRWPFGAALDITAPRKNIYNFVSYYKDARDFITTTGHLGPSKKDLCGHTISELTGDAAIPLLQMWSHECVAAGKKPIALTTYPSSSDALLAVASGRSEALAFTTDTFAVVARSHSLGNTWKQTGFLFLPAELGYASAKGSDFPMPVLQRAVNMIIKNGTYGKCVSSNASAQNEISQAVLNPPVPG
jgi:polar amino acid transport system substrate-binding protein